MKSSDKAIQDYFSALLEEPSDKIIEPAPLQKLLDDVSKPPVQADTKLEEPKQVSDLKVAPVTEVAEEPSKLVPLRSQRQQRSETVAKIKTAEIDVKPELVHVVETPVDIATAPEVVAPAIISALVEQPAIPTEIFQALFFDVAGMTLAVPLEELGGIYNIEEDGVRHLFGKPPWFLGLMPHRDRQLNVVDTALWVMPEKYDETLAENLNYQYLVMLKDSDWGFACERLITTSQLEPADVNWRGSMGKRPWLRGMVKQKMCALMNVDALIELLDTGVNSQAT
ncbi:chemotaxis protein CheW [Echinimonas agarilytica]|uniref:Chemotaxis protein CheW n=1 Tax=Echinimonas agarilytica TaxID=1215918 RepID=A0AA41W5M1_9GAMM|nr:chemotaxis protein CheW [Echinimonas agarilytica]MCM2678992.1 chemotaxis protein CheW [Echinimonas agarilytica]